MDEKKDRARELLARIEAMPSDGNVWAVVEFMNAERARASHILTGIAGVMSRHMENKAFCQLLDCMAAAIKDDE